MEPGNEQLLLALVPGCSPFNICIINVAINTYLFIDN